MNANEKEKIVQDRKKGTERGQTKLGKTHVDYWAKRIQKRTFLGRDGVLVTIPDYQIRLKHAGREGRFNLKTANAAEAASKAREIYVYLAANGWEATLKKYKAQAPEKKADLTIPEFVEHYRKAVKVIVT